MSVVDRATAQAAAVQVRDETGTSLNTATRVGGAMKDFVDSVLFSGAVAALADRTILRSAIAAGTFLAGLVLSNPDVATTGGAGDLSKNSPAVVLHSETFDTGVRRDNWVRFQSRPVGGGSPGQHLVVSMAQTLQSGGFTADTASLTDVLEVTPTLTSLLGSGHALVVPGSVSAGVSPATAGIFRTGNAQGIYGATVGGANVSIAIVGGDDGVHYGDTNATNATIQSAGQFAVLVGANTELTINGTVADFQNNEVRTTSHVVIGNGSGYYAESSPSGTPVRIGAVNATEDVFIGDSVNGTSVTYQTKAGGTHTWSIGVNTEFSLSDATANFQNNTVQTSSYFISLQTGVGTGINTLGAVVSNTTASVSSASGQHSPAITLEGTVWDPAASASRASRWNLVETSFSIDSKVDALVGRLSVLHGWNGGTPIYIASFGETLVDPGGGFSQTNSTVSLTFHKAATIVTDAGDLTLLPNGGDVLITGNLDASGSIEGASANVLAGVVAESLALTNGSAGNRRVVIGANAATAGAIGIRNNEFIQARNAINTDDRKLIGLDTNNAFVVGDAGCVGGFYDVQAGQKHIMRVGGNRQQVTASGVTAAQILTALDTLGILESV